MAIIKSILCPIDLSECSAHALDYAIAFSKTLRANLQLLHVYEDPIARVPFGRAGTAGLASAARDDVEEARKKRYVEIERLHQLCREHGLTTDAEEVEGVPAETIVKVAQERNFDLIAMGTHGRTGLKHVLLGSVAERVVRTASCPVLTVRSPGK